MKAKTKTKRKPREIVHLSSWERDDLFGKPLQIDVVSTRTGTKMYLIERSPDLAERLNKAIASVCLD